MSDFLKKAYELGRVKDLSEAFKEYPPEEEWHHGDIDYFINDENVSYGDEILVGDIVFVRKYYYENGDIGYKHLFVIIDKNNMAVPIENFGMLISSKIDKIKYPSNVFLPKDNINNLKKDSIVKTDYVYKLLEKDIVFKLGKVDKEQIDRYKSLFLQDK